MDEMKAAPTIGRQAGRTPLGRLRMGQIVNVTQPQRATIPSKFETVLNTGSREKDGFLRRTHRFNEAEDDLPGPGAYHTPTPLIKDPTGEHSSKKGMGAFASSEKRWYEAPRPLFVPPGPGKYDDSNDTSNGVSLRGTSSFASPVPRAAVNGPNKVILPGPGQYDPVIKAPSSPYAGESSIFRSSTRRIDFNGQEKLTIPGPGAYGDAVLKAGSVAELAIEAKTRPALVNNPLDPEHPRPAPPITDAIFRSQTERDGKRMARPQGLDPRNLPPVPCLPTSPTCSPHKATSATDGTAAAKSDKASSMFAATNLDRFGNPLVRHSRNKPVPGPGEYFNPEETKKMLISSSWALCGSERFTESRNKIKPPGPAFYNPKPVAKQSFHAKTPALWV